MIHPQEYVEIEKAKKHFNVGRFVRILPEDFHGTPFSLYYPFEGKFVHFLFITEHINIFAVHETDKLIISISKSPDEFDNYIGIIRSKLVTSLFKHAY